MPRAISFIDFGGGAVEIAGCVLAAAAAVVVVVALGVALVVWVTVRARGGGRAGRDQLGHQVDHVDGRRRPRGDVDGRG